MTYAPQGSPQDQEGTGREEKLQKVAGYANLAAQIFSPDTIRDFMGKHRAARGEEDIYAHYSDEQIFDMISTLKNESDEDLLAARQLVSFDLGNIPTDTLANNIETFSNALP